MTRVALACALLAGCKYTWVRDQCPQCTVVERRGQEPPSTIRAADVPAGTRTVFLLVPGLLGYGWEWDDPYALLERAPGVSTQVFWWSPWSSLWRLTDELVAATHDLLARMPPSATRLVIVGHSAAGIFTALATERLVVPPGRTVLVANIGTPYAGMNVGGLTAVPDHHGASFLWSVGAVFARYPAPAPGVTVESWVTPWPDDPVMMPRLGHDPKHPAVGPPGPRHLLPEHADHNRVLKDIIAELLRR